MMRTSEVHHKKVVVPDKYWKGKDDVYYIARYPEGDAHIHISYPVDKGGYAGSEVRFLLEDGTIETVKGPYCCDDFFDFGTAKKLSELLGDESITQKAYRLVVGKNLRGMYDSSKGKEKEEIIYQEPNYILGVPDNRINKEWEGLECHVYGRNAVYHRKIVDGKVA